MKKIVVLSDTHKNLKAIMKIASVADESDYVIHLGDHYADMDIFASLLGDKLYRVHGNCDSGAVKELIIEIEGVKVFATHGDLYGVKTGLGRLIKKAKDSGCKLALYGHTHRAAIEERDGITLVNPGCMTAYAAERSFAYIVINGEKITAVINDRTANE